MQTLHTSHAQRLVCSLSLSLKYSICNNPLDWRSVEEETDIHSFTRRWNHRNFQTPNHCFFYFLVCVSLDATILLQMSCHSITQMSWILLFFFFKTRNNNGILMSLLVIAGHTITEYGCLRCRFTLKLSEYCCVSVGGAHIAVCVCVCRLCCYLAVDRVQLHTHRTCPNISYMNWI